MKCISEFLQGYHHTKRQECKARARREVDRSGFWDNQDHLDNVLPVSFSFGREDTDQNDNAAPILSDGYGRNAGTEEYGASREDSSSHILNDNFPMGLQGNTHAMFYEHNSYQDHRSSDSENSSEAGHAADENREGKSASSSRLTSKETSMSGPVDKEGEWMYQLNALAKEHAQRNKPGKVPKTVNTRQSEV